MRKSRKKTSPNDPGRAIDSLRLRYPVAPLEFLLRVLNTPKLPMQPCTAAAKAALPYMHGKLKRIAVDDLGAPEKHSLDLSKLTAEELDQLEQLVVKATPSDPQN